MKKKYIVTLTQAERQMLQAMLSRGNAAARKLTHARVLLKADANSGEPAWNDGAIAQGLEVVPNDQPASAAEFARQNNLPIFDFASLEAAKTAADKETALGKLAADLDGKQMIVSGFIVGKIKDTPPKVMIGKYAWDGKAKGTPPSLYNTVLVTPKSAGDMPPVWWQEAVFKGTVHVTKEQAERAKNGIVSLADAVLAVAPASDQDLLVDAGPLLPLFYELTILVICGGLFLEVALIKGTRPTTGGSK